MSETPTITDTFTYTCPWGCEIRVEAGAEQRHDCIGTSLTGSEAIARACDEHLRVRWSQVAETATEEARGDAKADREDRLQETARRILEEKPDPSPYMPEGMDLSDIALFAGSAGELYRREISSKVFFARMADRLNRARAEALHEAVAKIEKSRTSKGIAARALDPGKAYAIAVLNDMVEGFARGFRAGNGADE